MVTPNEVAASSENESSPEITDSLPSGDEPLIPPGFDDRWPTEATDEVSTPGDEAVSDDSESQPEETTETAEDSPEAEAEETPEAETSTEESESEKEERVRSQEEWDKREASYRRRDSEQQNRLNELEQQVQTMQANYQNQLVDAEARAYVQALSQAYQDDEGMDQRSATARAEREVNLAKSEWLVQQTNTRLQQELLRERQERERTAAQASVEHLMREHGVPAQHRALLLGYTDPALAVDAAKALGEAEKLRLQTIEARQKEVPAGGESNTYDQGTGAGGTQTDADWLASEYSTGRSNDHARAAKILAAQGINLR